jgi:flagellar biosynthesis/type III secretory pathway M-ring protein FliF/YscJ
MLVLLVLPEETVFLDQELEPTLAVVVVAPELLEMEEQAV